MSDPSLAMQKAIVARLKSHSGLSALISQRVYDRAPQDAVYPFVQVGYFQTVDDGAACVDGTEIFIELQVWSRSVGQVEAKSIASQVRSALREWLPTLDDPFVAIGNIEHENTRFFGDGDGITTRSVVNFKALCESA
jgi:phytoene dehydrogenase-like protein